MAGERGHNNKKRVWGLPRLQKKHAGGCGWFVVESGEGLCYQVSERVAFWLPARVNIMLVP